MKKFYCERCAVVVSGLQAWASKLYHHDHIYCKDCEPSAVRKYLEEADTCVADRKEKNDDASM